MVQELIINKAGEVVGHKTKRHPATTIAKDALASMLRASALFGFDPSSRARLSLGESTAADPFTTFIESLGADKTTDAEESHIPS